ncbi:MAG TPA: helix-turn-helix transcriptional regulator [Egicoccus sp.]|nr:helix-turn-helix transcriptional regulator [Egicoccus sp.]HSK23064.1 helix-turn-helix transcriptional regulator [Egicoccus sp.]
MGRTPEAARDNTVRRARRAMDLTQADLAEQVGVSRQTIVALESGGYAPSVYLALALADVLGTSVESLFGPTTTAGVAGTAPGETP